MKWALFLIRSGLRTDDIQKLTYEQFNSVSLTIQEEKTGKTRTIKINETLKKVFQKHRGNGLIFMSQKNSVFTTQSLNRILKKIFKQLSKKNALVRTR
jgi:integrase